MARDPYAYLLDCLDACTAIDEALGGIDLKAYTQQRLIRSAVEREFILIGEALNRLSQVSPELFAQVGSARLIINFRNLLTHDYGAIDDEAVYGIATSDLEILKRDLRVLMADRPRP
jgi:uncharacterized protein with HEPN domain